MRTLPRLLLILTLPLYVLDQVTKWLIVLRFDPPLPGHTASQEVYPVIDGFFNIVRVHNQGAAFGLGNGTAWAPLVFFGIALIALGTLGYFWKRGAFSSLLLRLSAGLLTAGILGNLTDRVVQGFYLPLYQEDSVLTRLSHGYVVDFLDFKLALYGKLFPDSGGHWPSFNVADSCICVAAFFLILSTFRGEGESKEKKKGEAQAKA
ncbi:MAG: signal peptidase II [Roseibacillus sp.]